MAATTTTTTAATAAAAAARSEGNFLPNLEGCGFNFDLSLRNSSLQERGHLAPKATSTGTTIAGILFKDGVVLGADTRATGGSMVFDKNCEKIHHLSRLMYCCGAGTAADTENVTSMISSQLELHRLSTGKEPRVITALTMLKQHLFKYQGHIGAALVLGGVDAKGAHLFTVAPHGSTDKLPYVTMGSGSLAAMAVFESGWRKDLPLDDAVQLVVQSIESGIFNDLGSGSNVDICVITKEGVDYRRNYVIANPRPAKQLSYKFPIGTTEFLQEKQQIDVMEIEQS